MDYRRRGKDHIGPVKVVGPVTKCPGCIGRKRILDRRLKVGETFVHELCGTTIVVVPVDFNQPIIPPDEVVARRVDRQYERTARSAQVDQIVAYAQGRQRSPNGSI